MSTSQLITIISNHSDRYGDALLRFLFRYQLIGLWQATEAQLREFIEKEFPDEKLA